MKRSWLLGGMILAALVGLLTSAYLAYLSLQPPTSCPVGDVGIFSCNSVLWSRYSHVFGISVAVLGLGWFIIALALSVLAWKDRRYLLGVVGWSILGAVGVAAFVYTEVFLLGSICSLCTVAHVSGLVILAFSLALLRVTR